jgi:hypothetical protein
MGRELNRKMGFYIPHQYNDEMRSRQMKVYGQSLINKYLQRHAKKQRNEKQENG